MADEIVELNDGTDGLIIVGIQRRGGAGVFSLEDLQGSGQCHIAGVGVRLPQKIDRQALPVVRPELADCRQKGVEFRTPATVGLRFCRFPISCRIEAFDWYHPVEWPVEECEVERRNEGTRQEALDSGARSVDCRQGSDR